MAELATIARPYAEGAVSRPCAANDAGAGRRWCPGRCRIAPSRCASFADNLKAVAAGLDLVTTRAKASCLATWRQPSAR